MRLDDVARFNPGVDKSQFEPTDEVPFVPMPAVEAGTGKIDTSERRPFSKVKNGFTAFATGDVLFAKITPCMENGKMAVVPPLPQGIGFGTTEFHVLRPTRALDKLYLYHFVSSAALRHEAQHHMTGAVGQKRVPKRFLQAKPFPLPPLPEQQRIVEKIETLFAELDKGEEALLEVQKLLARYRQSVLKAAVTGELTAQWRAANGRLTETGEDMLARILKKRRESWRGRGKYKEPVEPQTDGLPELPEGWVWVSLDMILADFITGPFGSMLHKSDYVDGGAPIINPINLIDQTIVPDDRKGVGPATLERLSRFAVLHGDVVIARRGDMGRCAPVTETEAGWLCGTGSMILRPADPVQSRYLSAAISSHTSKSHLELHAVGTTMKNLNQRALFSTPIALPSRAEQEAVVDAIDEANVRISQIEMWCDAERRRSAALRQSILKDAFSGKLVPQDPSDEPAEELLQRIRRRAG